MITKQNRFFYFSLFALLIYLLLWIFYATDAWSANRLNRELLLWPVTLLLLWFYGQGYRSLQDNPLPLKILAALGVVLALAAVLIEPFHSTDIHGYINRGWQQIGYGLNPYVYTVDDIPGWEQDPMITDHWVNNPSPYGFFYLQIARGLTWLSGGNPGLTVIVFKSFNLLLHFGIIAMVWLGAKRLNHPRPDLALYLYAWNPLILIHILCNGHNDIVMGFLLTLAALVTVAGQWLWILPVLVAATLVKYASLVVLPLALLFFWKQRAWKTLAIGAVLGIIVFIVSGSSYLPDWEQFRLGAIQKNAFVSHGSLHSAIWSLYKALYGFILPPPPEPYLDAYMAQRDVFRAILKNILLAGFVLFYAIWCFRVLRKPEYSAQNFVRDMLLMMVVLISLVSLKYYPWYLGMFFPLALFLSPGDGLRRFVILLSGCQLFSLTFIGQAHILNFLVMTLLPLLLTLRIQYQEPEQQAVS